MSYGDVTGIPVITRFGGYRARNGRNSAHVYVLRGVML